MILTITFIIALILAWPTTCISLVVWFSFFIFVSWLKAYTRLKAAERITRDKF